MLVLWMLLASIVFVLGLIHWYQTASRTAKLMNQFPSFWRPPILGHAALFPASLEKMFSKKRRIVASFGETFSSWTFIYPIMHVVTAEDAEVILSNTKYHEKGWLYGFLKPWLNNGILLSSGAKWQRRRKVLTPAFHFNILRRFVTIFGEHSADLVAKLDEECDKPKTNIVPLLNHTTLYNICETAMGTKLNEKSPEQKNYIAAIQKIGDTIIERAFSPLLYNKIIFYFSPVSWKQNSYVKTLHQFTNRVIQERKKNFRDEDVENLNDEEEDLTKTKKRLAMLDLLISLQNKQNDIDDEGIQEEVDTFMFGGYDTISVASKYLLLTLANHPDVQNKVMAELDSIFGTSDRQPTYDDLQQMKYTEMVIKECLRLYPSATYIIRKAKEDIKLTSHIIPRGSEIFIHIYDIHRDPKYYPDPEKFDPDRFLPENCKGRHPYAYVPFSAGPRNCIGQRFAMLELKSIVASVLRHFVMKPIDQSSDLRWTIDLVLRSIGPIYVKFEKRHIQCSQ